MFDSLHLRRSQQPWLCAIITPRTLLFQNPNYKNNPKEQPECFKMEAYYDALELSILAELESH